MKIGIMASQISGHLALTSIEYLPIGGGGGGGAEEGAGAGGAGGLQTSLTYAITTGVAYGVTIGAGGAGS